MPNSMTADASSAHHPRIVEQREPAASAVIYGGVDAKAIVFDGVDEALRVPNTDLRLFGKPESFVKRRMGVAVANADTTDEARQRAKLAASRVKPVKGNWARDVTV